MNELTNADTLFDVWLYLPDGGLYHTASNIRRDAAHDFAERHRPRCGSSYVVLAGTKPNLDKTYYRRSASYRPRYPSVKRPTRKARIALAQRLVNKRRESPPEQRQFDLQNSDALINMIAQEDSAKRITTYSIDK